MDAVHPMYTTSPCPFQRRQLPPRFNNTQAGGMPAAAPGTKLGCDIEGTAKLQASHCVPRLAEMKKREIHYSSWREPRRYESRRAVIGPSIADRIKLGVL